VLVDRLIVEQGRAAGVRFIKGGEVAEVAQGRSDPVRGSIGSTNLRCCHRSDLTGGVADAARDRDGLDRKARAQSAGY